MLTPAPDELHELEVQRVLRWLDIEFEALGGVDGLDEVARRLREKMALQAIKDLPFEAVSHALGRWLNGDNADKRWCSAGLIAALGLKEHVPALRTLRQEAADPLWERQLEQALRALAPRHRDE